MRTKLLITSLITVTMAVGQLTFAQNNTLLVGSGSGAPGSLNNPVSITLANNETAAGILFTLTYDASSLSLFAVATTERSASQGGFAYNIIEDGVVGILVYDPDGQNLEPGTGEIVRLYFDVSMTSGSGQKPITITEAAISGTSYQGLQVTMDDGAFEVTQDEALAAPSNLNIELGESEIQLSWDPPSLVAPQKSTVKADPTAGQLPSAKRSDRLFRRQQNAMMKRTVKPLKNLQNQQAVEEIQLDVPVTRSVGEDEILEFFVRLQNTSDASTLRFQTLNSSGDPDMFIRLGAAPDLTDGIYDFESSYSPPQEELIMVSRNSIPPLQDGDWFVSIYGFEAATFTLVASLGFIMELDNGISVTQSLAFDEYLEFFIDVPASATELTFATSNSTGDPDLFVRFGEPPDLDDFIFDFSSETVSEELSNVNENTFPAVQAGRWYVSVFGFEQSSFTLTSNFSPDTGGEDNRPPVFELLGTLRATSGEALQFTVTASDPDGDAITLTASGVPTGANFSDNNDGTGQFNWTPTDEQIGTTNIVFTATDNRGGSASQTVPIVVQSSAGRLLQAYNIYRSEEADPRRTGSIIGMVDAGVTRFSDPLPVFGMFYYQVTAVYDRGESHPSNQMTILVTDIEEELESSILPHRFTLEQNYPNPFNPSTLIHFSVPVNSDIRIVIYNLMGQAIRLLVNNPYQPGEYEVAWDGKNDDGEIVPVGIYIYQMQGENFLATQKMLFLK